MIHPISITVQNRTALSKIVSGGCKNSESTLIALASAFAATSAFLS